MLYNDLSYYLMKCEDFGGATTFNEIWYYDYNEVLKKIEETLPEEAEKISYLVREALEDIFTDYEVIYEEKIDNEKKLFELDEEIRLLEKDFDETLDELEELKKSKEY